MVVIPRLRIMSSRVESGGKVPAIDSVIVHARGRKDCLVPGSILQVAAIVSAIDRAV